MNDSIQTCYSDYYAHSLFEHEFIKHGTCMGLSSDEYENKVEELFYEYTDVVDEKCQQKECSIFIFN